MPGQRGKKAAVSVDVLLSLPHSLAPPKEEIAMSGNDEDEYSVITLLLWNLVPPHLQLFCRNKTSFAILYRHHGFRGLKVLVYR